MEELHENPFELIGNDCTRFNTNIYGQADACGLFIAQSIKKGHFSFRKAALVLFL
jgi:hypothetical protein